jgi:hypothetical protein
MPFVRILLVFLALASPALARDDAHYAAAAREAGSDRERGAVARGVALDLPPAVLSADGGLCWSHIPRRTYPHT